MQNMGCSEGYITLSYDHSVLTTSLLNTIYFLLFSLFCSYAHHLLLALIPPKSEKREISKRLFPMMKHVHFAANVH